MGEARRAAFADGAPLADPGGFGHGDDSPTGGSTNRGIDTIGEQSRNEMAGSPWRVEVGA